MNLFFALKTYQNMKRILTILTLIFVTQISFSEEIDTVGVGIKFETKLSWDEIKLKAKREKKYIFLDLFASWCGPCKFMDNNVFSMKEVGDYVNTRFISVRVQMDSTKSDDVHVKRWYSDAKKIKMIFNPNFFPTFIFLSPEGVLVHKYVGSRYHDQFLQLCSNALNEKTQYFTLVKNLENNTLDKHSIRQLLSQSIEFGDTSISYKLSSRFIKDLSDEEKLDKENIQLIASLTKSSKDPGFAFLYNNSTLIDSIASNYGYAEYFVKTIIFNEIASPIVKEAIAIEKDSIEWATLREKVKLQYGLQYSDRVILDAKILFYGSKKMWSEYSSCLIQMLNEYSLELSPININNICYTIFQRSTDINHLLKAIEAMKSNDRIKSVPGDMDTYANLLYKAGFINEAIEWQNKAVQMAPADTRFIHALNEMKQGNPTWPVK